MIRARLTAANWPLQPACKSCQATELDNGSARSCRAGVCWTRIRPLSWLQPLTPLLAGPSCSGRARWRVTWLRVPSLPCRHGRLRQPFEARSIQPIRPPSLTHLRGWERLPLLVVAASPFAEAAGLRRAHEGRQRTALNILSRAARHNPHETLRRQAARPPRAEIVVLSCTTYLYVRFA